MSEPAMERSGAQQRLNGLEKSNGWDPIDPAPGRWPAASMVKLWFLQE